MDFGDTERDGSALLFDAKSQIGTLNTALITARADVTRLTAERDASRLELQQFRESMPNGDPELRTQLAAVTTERDALRSQVATLTAREQDYTLRLCGDLTKFGVKKDAITFPTGEPTGTGAKGGEKSSFRNGANLTEIAQQHIAATGYKPPQPQP
jgi:hypothetical protein